MRINTYQCSFFKKIRDTKGTLHAEMGSIKDRNGMDLTEAEDIKKWWQEYTEEQYGINLTLYAPRNQRVAVSLHRDFCFIAVVWNQTQGFPDVSVGKEPCSAEDTSLIPGSGRFPGGRHCNILAWRIHGWRSLEGYSPWGRKESDTTEGTEHASKRGTKPTRLQVACCLFLLQ